MYEWSFVIQKMLDWIEEHAKENPTLAQMACQIGYSRFYCSFQFRKVAGMTLKRYMAGRRLYSATIEIRDSQKPVLSIALEYGFSTQSALTSAFQAACGCTRRRIEKIRFRFRFPYEKSCCTRPIISGKVFWK